MTHMWGLKVRDWDEVNTKWELTSKRKGPEKIRTFLWLVLHGRLLTNEKRYRRHLVSHPTFDEANESLYHVLRSCLSSLRIWIKIFGFHVVSEWSTVPFEEWFTENIKKDDGIRGCSWSVLFATTCRVLLQRRNDEVIGGKYSDDREIAHSIWAKARNF
ncbi:hypothetical protein Scep_019941 [Stephania cephalantha]|uniref:Reverse transcriptase zinc-binding domain-containing protein n=1 Tax=Stephania cephalantha TaxID=152367 RepID=A0AAP0IBY6_9MAGN